MAMKNSLELGMMQTSPRFTSGAPSGSNKEQVVGRGEGGEVRVLQRGPPGGFAAMSPRFIPGAPSICGTATSPRFIPGAPSFCGTDQVQVERSIGVNDG